MNKREKTGGRKRGTLNHTTTELRNLFAGFVSANISTLQSDFDKLEPKERLHFMDKMARLIMPPPVDDLQKLSEEDLDRIILKLKSTHHEQAE